ncbi:fatty acid desaturase [Mesorhizobium sp. CAU 1732]|uniref:fatty acid desaturase n=1 Tax=Mesorhizobium sp. CAU 1732 TaxID=3140358 RepID=UPI0032614DFC
MKNLATQSTEDAALRQWTKVLARYRTPHRGRSVFELAITIIPFALLWTLAAAAVHYGYWFVGLALTVPAAGLLLRLFMIQHDCGHGAFFAHRRGDDWTGRFLGVLTLTPYAYWRRAHAAHHATAGNLDERGVGDITTLTVKEYSERSTMGKIGYRLYRHPVVMFGIGPIWLFGLKQRLPFGMMRSVEPWISTMATNVALMALVSALIWTVGLVPFLLVHIPIVVLAGSAGIWLFYVQHQFEETHWSNGEDWDFRDAALHGSSFYDLPAALNWLTGNIGVHHVHHLSSRVPYYRLPEVLNDYPELRNTGRITILESLRCVKLTLWCEERRRLISFREARAIPQS